MIRAWNKHEGFALPTILIASVVMLVVLVSAVTATESTRTALDRQYYNQLAREAAESGLAIAQLCLQYNGYVPSWSNSYPLRPDRDCTGVNNNGVSQYIINQSNIRTTVTVPYPTNMNVSQLVTATGKVELLRPSTGQPWRTYTYSTSARIGVSLSLNSVAFSYAGGYGASFGTIVSDGSLKMVGYNGWGQLSNGTYSSTLTPTKFILNGTDKPAVVFTNFVSQGYNTFVLTDKGDIYGAGLNNYGQLGDGSTSSRNQAVKFTLPAGKQGQYVALGGFQTYVLTTDGNIYSAGSCSSGKLGYNYTISGCTDQASYKRVNLPTPTSDTNTIPTTNIVTDYQSAFVRMQGGKIYGWGGNSTGLLADGTTNDTSTPIQVGTFGNSGQPKAVDIETDGITLWVLDSNGDVWASGDNTYGELGGEKVQIKVNIGKCLDNTSGDGVSLQFYACSAGNVNPNQQFEFGPDGSIYIPSENKCVDNTGSNGSSIGLQTCDGTTDQKFVYRDDGRIYMTSKAKCLDNTNADGTSVGLSGCTGTAQVFSLPASKSFVKVALPDVAGNATKIVTDQWFTSILTSSGQVWSMGVNTHGQLGNGTIKTYQPYPVKFILPSGVTALDVYSTSYLPTSDTKYTNTFVVGSDGKVYGAGSNYFGQLGDGTTTDRSTPVAMNVINGVDMKALQVESGYGTTIVLTDNHKVYTVGNNGNGQLGDGTTTNSSTPKANQYTNALPITLF